MVTANDIAGGGGGGRRGGRKTEISKNFPWNPIKSYAGPNRDCGGLLKTPEIAVRVRGWIRDALPLVGEGSKGRGRVSLVGRGFNGLSLWDEGVLWTVRGVTFWGIGMVMD